MRYPFVIIAALSVSACVPAEYTADKMANDLKDNVYHTSDRIQQWAMTPPVDERAPKAIPASYCYTVLQDVVCYRQPMPGWENRLVAYQGTAAQPPQPAIMQPMPIKQTDLSSLPANRAVNAKPVFVSIPADIKETDKDKESQEVITTHEQVIDPALAPQL